MHASPARETLATFRSQRVAYHLALQGRAQGEEVYGITGFRAFLNNLQTVILGRATLRRLPDRHRR